LEFSVNYSVEAAQLIAEGKIRVDRLKCADWPDMIATAGRIAPVYVHFPFDVGSVSGRVADYDVALPMMRETDTPYMNFHIVSYSRDPADGFYDRLVCDVHGAAERVGKDKIVIENIPWFGEGCEFHRYSVDARMISSAMRETGAGFLLDLSHARIAAHYLGIDPREYIESLPVNQLRELHVTGIRMHKTRLADHMELGDQDWEFARWAMERIEVGEWSRPWMVAFEYGGIGEPFNWRSRREVIEEQAPRLFEMVHGVID
jgi:hypothetical protein